MVGSRCVRVLPIVVRRVLVIELACDKLLTGDLVEKTAIDLALLQFEILSTKWFFFLLLACCWSVEFVGGDHVLMTVLDGASLPVQQKHLVNQTCHTVHLQKVKNVGFFVEALLRDFKPLVPVDVMPPPVVVATAGFAAATAFHEARDKDVGELADVELLPLL